MAEAVVQDPMRYFCHRCKVDINIPNADFTCPLCSGGFIEELATARNNMGNAAAAAAAANRNNAGEIGVSNSRDERLAGWNALRDDLTTLLMSRNASNFEISFGSDGSRHISITGGNGEEDQNGGGSGGQNRTGEIPNVEDSRVHTQNFDRFDNVLLDFLQTLSLNDVDGGSQLIFMGNPGDYAWGREGIDTIVTQLLNQMDNSGPPPLPKEKINEIPIEKISAEEIKNKLQCSVCWEDFKLDETVRRLPCSHIYHEACIIPWLNLHNTCPICRKSLADETETEQVADQQRPTRGDGRGTYAYAGSIANSVRIPFLASLQNVMQQQQQQQQQQQSANNRSHSNTGGSNGPNTTSQDQDNVFSFENNNFDLDMDLD